MASKKKVTKKQAAKKETAKKSITKDFWLTTEQMAASCGVSPQAFRLWGVPSVAKQAPYVFYVAEAVIQNRMEKQAAKLRHENKTPASEQELTRSEREEKLRLTKAQAEGQELKNAQLRKELAPVDVIEWVLGKAAGQISAVLESIPSLLKKRNAKLTASNIELIRREIVKAQNAASQMTVDLDEYYERTDSSNR
jgi:phage terminase Nu1 subunit (DNA packaging protein)